MIKTKFTRPFKTVSDIGNNTRVFKERFRPGVYIIKKNNNVLYVGFSRSDVTHTMYRHFYAWNDSQYRVTFNPFDENIKARVIYTNRPEQAATLEKALINKLKPKYNYQEPKIDANGSPIYSKYLNLTAEAPF